MTNLSKGSLLSSLTAAAMTATITASACAAAGAALAGAGATLVVLTKFFSNDEITLDTIVTKSARNTSDKNTIATPNNDENKLSEKLIYSVVIIRIPPVNIWVALKPHTALKLPIPYKIIKSKKHRRILNAF